ncbi:hypothetical protein Landi51_13960, partial [Colletotrichum acutatum]
RRHPRYYQRRHRPTYLRSGPRQHCYSAQGLVHVRDSLRLHIRPHPDLDLPLPPPHLQPRDKQAGQEDAASQHRLGLGLVFGLPLHSRLPVQPAQLLLGQVRRTPGQLSPCPSRAERNSRPQCHCRSERLGD